MILLSFSHIPFNLFGKKMLFHPKDIHHVKNTGPGGTNPNSRSYGPFCECLPAMSLVLYFDSLPIACKQYSMISNYVPASNRMYPYLPFTRDLTVPSINELTIPKYICYGTGGFQCRSAW